MSEENVESFKRRLRLRTAETSKRCWRDSTPRWNGIRRLRSCWEGTRRRIEHEAFASCFETWTRLSVRSESSSRRPRPWRPDLVQSAVSAYVEEAGPKPSLRWPSWPNSVRQADSDSDLPRPQRSPPSRRLSRCDDAGGERPVDRPAPTRAGRPHVVLPVGHLGTQSTGTTPVSMSLSFWTREPVFTAANV